MPRTLTSCLARFVERTFGLPRLDSFRLFLLAARWPLYALSSSRVLFLRSAGDLVAGVFRRGQPAGRLEPSCVRP